jgi:hypothetical protein
MIKLATATVALAICSSFVAAQTAAPDPRMGQVDRVIALAKASIRGVDQCFNPSYARHGRDSLAGVA